MSQNQSYFWQTTRRNVYLRRSAKFHLLMALMTVLTFSTVCLADYEPKFNDNGLTMGIPTEISSFEKELANAEILRANGGNQIPNIDENTKKPEKSQTGFIDAFTASISVILFTELGDKTFFIAAIMAMRHPRLIVFAGAISALALMTVLSVVFGMAATIIPKVYTYYISTALFAIFGLKMIYDGYMMKPTDAQEELEEVQSDLRKREDELMRRAARRKYDDSDAKRKNSNSDKEEGEEADLDSGAGAAQTVLSSADIGPALVKHRQRKLLNNNVSINNNITSSLSNNGCELVNGDRDRDREHVESGGNDVFLDDRDPKMPTFHSSPALAQTLTSSLSLTPSDSNRTNNSDDFNDKINHNHHSGEAQHKRRKNVGNGHSHSNGHGHGNDATAMVHSAAVSNANARRASQQAIVIKTNGSIGGVGGGADAGVGTITNGIKNGLSGHSLSSAAGQSNGELKQVGGSNIRLERDVTAALVQDPESGVLRKNTKKSAAYLTTRVLMQAFTMTFLAEWGDRSQLTTIILAASKDAYGVIVGGVLGHSICTGLAVIGGRIVAAKISVRTVTIIGGIVFLGFAVYALIMTPDDI